MQFGCSRPTNDSLNAPTLIQEAVSAWKYLWLFKIGRMRNSHLKGIQAEWKGRVPETRFCNRLLMYARSAVDTTARLFCGRVSVMAVAFGTTLGTTPELEFMPGLGKTAKVRI